MANTASKDQVRDLMLNIDYDAELSDSLRQDIYDKVVKARVQMLFKYPFFAQLAIRLELVECMEKWLPTAATDGRKLFYNPHFFNAMSQDNITFIVAHEVLHCVYDHMTPMKQGFDARLYNCAADYNINMELVKHKVGVMPECGLLDWDYDGMNSYEIYDRLIEKRDAGELPDGLQPMDIHIMIDEEGNVEVETGGSGDGEGNGDGKPVLSEAEKQQIANEIKEAMLAAAQSEGAGNLPGGVKRLLDSLTEPKLNWKELVNASVESCVRNDYTFMRQSRRAWHTDAIMPGTLRDFEIDVAISLDMSGSITIEQGRDFVSEVHGMLEQFPNYKLRIWSFDTEVYNYDEFTSDDGRDITEYEPMGGGGTDFMVNWNFMKQEGIEPQQFIMFTDGYPWSSWGDENYCDTLFVIHSNHDKSLQAPFGRSVHYENF